MAASAATAYDQAQDAGGSESSDLELDDAPDQLLSQLPNFDDFGAPFRSVQNFDRSLGSSCAKTHFTDSLYSNKIHIQFCARTA